MRFLTLASLTLTLCCAVTAGLTEENRFAKEWRAYQTWDKANNPATDGIIAIGSSTIRMWSTLTQEMAPLPVLNRGFGGAKVADALEAIPFIVLPYKPRIIVYYVGDNDLQNAEADMNKPIEGFTNFVTEVRKTLPKVHFVYLSIKPSPKRTDAWPKAQQVNALMVKQCAADPAMTFVDVGSTLLDANGVAEPSLYKEDKLHMMPTGYARWTPVLKPVLEKLWAAGAGK